MDLVGPQSTITYKKKRKSKEDATSDDSDGIPKDIDTGKKQKKKKLRHFEFKECACEWKDVVNEARYTAFTHSSSFVGNVKYDQEEQSMEIILNGKTYEFCNVPQRKYDGFEGASSKGEYFNRNIKNQHDC